MSRFNNNRGGFGMNNFQPRRGGGPGGPMRGGLMGNPHFRNHPFQNQNQNRRGGNNNFNRAPNQGPHGTPQKQQQNQSLPIILPTPPLSRTLASCPDQTYYSLGFSAALQQRQWDNLSWQFFVCTLVKKEFQSQITPQLHNRISCIIHVNCTKVWQLTENLQEKAFHSLNKTPKPQPDVSQQQQRRFEQNSQLQNSLIRFYEKLSESSAASELSESDRAGSEAMNAA